MPTRASGFLAGLALCQALAGVARAADSTEIWPEVSAFVPLSPQARLHLGAAYAEGKESDVQSLDLAACLDISLKPILREQLQTEDWQRSRYFWARIGYARIFNATSDTGTDVAEDRGIVSFYGKAPLPVEIWLEARVRADLRWIGDDYSNRYRVRAEASREYAFREHPVVPYLNCEWFYDTRYGRWARTLCTAGMEVTLDKHFRYEVYLARQNDQFPSEKTLAALGIVAKWHH